MLKYSIAVNILYIQFCKNVKTLHSCLDVIRHEISVAQLCCVDIKIPN